MKNFVKFNEDYFKKTIYEYQDWEFAFCRETAQNSCDAKATEIHYTIEDTEDGIQIICEDNGVGMTKDILLTKFLVMGASYKDNEESVGGFGYAKGIILFCHKSYSIHTNDLLLTGSYGRYNDPISIKKRKGTKLVITMDRDMSSTYSLRSKLTEWVENSNLKNTKVFLNGEELSQSGKKFDYKKKTKIGNLMISESDGYAYMSNLWIRMRGMAMFRKTIYSDEIHFNGFIDLDSKSSIECLTANRDGLKNEYEYGLSELIKYLSSELTSLQSSKMDDFEINIKEDTNYIYEDEGVFIDNELVPQDHPQDKKVLKKTNSFQGSHSRQLGNISNIISEDDTESMLEKAKKENSSMQPKIENIIDKIDKKMYPDSFLIKIDKLEDKSNREILKEYNKSVKILNQSRIKKQSKIWNHLINVLLQACYDKNIGDLSFDGKNWISQGRTIHQGAIISNDSQTLGMCSRKDDKFHVLFNPILIKNNNLDSYGMMLIAVHEVAHIFEMDHGKYHSYLMFEIQNAFHQSGFKINKFK